MSYKFFCTVSCSVLLLTSLLLIFSVTAPSVHARNMHPIALHDLNGNETKIGDLKGPALVVNFWATWCLPCREELPRFSAMAKDYAASNVPFVLISIDELENLKKVRDFVVQQQLTLPVWVGANTEILQHFSRKEIVPATIILDEHGEVIRTINGQARDEDVKEAVDWLLSGRKGPSPKAVLKRY